MSVKTYTDRSGMTHDKQVINGEPSSNNPATYTAYKKALGGRVDDTRLAWFFYECQNVSIDYYLYYMYHVF